VLSVTHTHTCVKNVKLWNGTFSEVPSEDKPCFYKPAWCHGKHRAKRAAEHRGTTLGTLNQTYLAPSYSPRSWVETVGLWNKKHVFKNTNTYITLSNLIQNGGLFSRFTMIAVWLEPLLGYRWVIYSKLIIMKVAWKSTSSLTLLKLLLKCTLFRVFYLTLYMSLEETNKEWSMRKHVVKRCHQPN